jgi:hypothetical protein
VNPPPKSGIIDREEQFHPTCWPSPRRRPSNRDRHSIWRSLRSVTNSAFYIAP